MNKGKGKGNSLAAVGTGSCQGTVKSFNESKGWGFIDCHGADVFCHLKECVDGGVPMPGDMVTFDVEESPSKPGTMRAKNVAGGSGWPSGGAMSCAGGCGNGCSKGGYGPMWGGQGGSGVVWGASPGPYGCGKGQTMSACGKGTRGKNSW